VSSAFGFRPGDCAFSPDLNSSKRKLYPLALMAAGEVAVKDPTCTRKQCNWGGAPLLFITTFHLSQLRREPGTHVLLGEQREFFWKIPCTSWDPEPAPVMSSTRQHQWWAAPCVHVCMCACMYVCMYVCMHACMCACMYVCMYVCVCVCMCACMYMYVRVGTVASLS